MKKLWISLLCAGSLLSLTACQSQPSTPENASQNETTSTPETSQIQNNGKILIAYFTMPETDGTDMSSSASRVINNDELMGATEYVARVIQDNTGGDLFQIETEQTYPGTHDSLVDQAADEQDENARPALKTTIDNLDDYDVIFLGYPNWWGDMPMPLYTFLEAYDFSDKTIIPFNTHGGSRFSSTISTIEELQPNATVIEDGLTISRNDVTDAESEIVDWVESLGL